MEILDEGVDVVSILIEVLFEDLVRPEHTKPLNGKTYFSADGSIDEMMTYRRLID